MKSRCENAIFIDIAKLSNYKFIINKNGVATVIPKNDSIVYGVLWKITNNDEQSLDFFEGVGFKIYNKHYIEVELENKKVITALIYIAQNNTNGLPRKGYLEKIIHFAGLHKLPINYIKEVKLWMITEDIKL